MSNGDTCCYSSQEAIECNVSELKSLWRAEVLRCPSRRIMARVV